MSSISSVQSYANAAEDSLPQAASRPSGKSGGTPVAATSRGGHSVSNSDTTQGFDDAMQQAESDTQAPLQADSESQYGDESGKPFPENPAADGSLASSHDMSSATDDAGHTAADVIPLSVMTVHDGSNSPMNQGAPSVSADSAEKTVLKDLAAAGLAYNTVAVNGNTPDSRVALPLSQLAQSSVEKGEVRAVIPGAVVSMLQQVNADTKAETQLDAAMPVQKNTAILAGQTSDGANQLLEGNLQQSLQTNSSMNNAVTQAMYKILATQSASLALSQPVDVATGTVAMPAMISPPSTFHGGAALPAASAFQAFIVDTFGHHRWGQSFGEQVMMLVNQNVRSAEIRLNPANLGPIEVQIDITDDQVNVAFTSRHAVVREAMELALPRLREMLDENGLSLANTDISDQSLASQREYEHAESQMAAGEETAEAGTLAEQGNIGRSEAHRFTRSGSTSLVDIYI